MRNSVEIKPQTVMNLTQLKTANVIKGQCEDKKVAICHICQELKTLETKSNV